MQSTPYEMKLSKKEKKAIKRQLTLELSKLWGAKRLQEHIKQGRLKWMKGFK